MKKILILLIVAILLLTGCGSDRNEDIVELEERFFIAQFTHINQNADDYIGRTVRYEGLFRTIHWHATGEDYHMIVRLTEGCCSPEGVMGFEIDLGNISPFADDAWVEVVGELEWYMVDDVRFLRLVATSVTELEERGTELVTA